MSTASCDAVTYTNSSGTTATAIKATTQNWQFIRGTKGDWYKDAKITLDAGSNHIEIPVANIQSFTGDTPLYMLANPGGTVYVHSKVAIIDDLYACVGSANFGPRSMTLDDELSAFMEGQWAAKFRQDLWSEYFKGGVVGATGPWTPTSPPAPGSTGITPGDWWRTAQSNQGKTPGAGQILVLPIPIVSYPTKPPSGTSYFAGPDDY